MTEKDVRDLIQEDVVLKMLGPGYAKDLISCSPDCSDEIIPENPRYAYTLGVLVPQVDTHEPNDDDDQSLEDSEEDNAVEDDTADDQQAVDDKLLSGRVENDDQDEHQHVSFSHIGLITCVSKETKAVCVNLNYGTYRKLSWEESIEQVKVFTGHFSGSIEQAIERFGEDEKLQSALTKNCLPDDFKQCFIVDKENGTLALADIKKPESILCIPNAEYPIEADMVNLLFGSHYKREHHTYQISIDLEGKDGEKEMDDNIKIYWSVFEARGKRFLKILMRSIAKSPIYQPEIIVTAPKGEIVSYVEPITSLDNDIENNVNEFVYRKVRNYGKGVNCALGWDKNGQRVYTTFTPSFDVAKFSNEVSAEYKSDAIEWSCALRNLSIWSEFADEVLVSNLRKFIEGYAQWHGTQKTKANAEPQYQKETEFILEKQKELLQRLNENVDYLETNSEALQCFKIANTAMLLQMVVARHPEFEKNRDSRIYNEEPDWYDQLAFFSEARYTSQMGEPKYRPFQLAFLLMNIKSTFETDDKYHNAAVDLIWFPTGGGKTEAYLALTALTIVQRRRRGQKSGVSVIMRYTLRMLTSQQFERASYLICALEFLRRKDVQLGLGNSEISIGIYVGSGVTPNKKTELSQGRYNKFFNNVETRRNENPFPVSYCPWCGSRMVSPDGNSIGYNQKNGSLCCINQRCGFSQGLPIYYIDEQVYQKKPTLLFATVDKFAQLYTKQANQLLNPNGGIDAPDLIIQDELHLLVGALGSIVGLFESVVEALISKNGRVPKIVASTATTRNTKALIIDLYNREVNVFPPQGLDYDDNYFSHIEPEAKRRHIGMMPLGNTNSNNAEIRLAAYLLLARAKVFKKYIEDNGYDWKNDEDVNKACSNNGELLPILDNYWTSVFYFNSLKDLGRSRSRVSQEVFENFRAHKSLYQIPPSLSLLQTRFDQRVLEFTSRIESNRIKSFLTEAESRVRLGSNREHINVESGKDMIFASNMISVGIDIARWNLMVMVGQPRSTAEYVQSSSRVARNTYGLVINLLNPLRLREHSLFENYRSFHATYYKSIEPLSITPLTEATIRHNVLNNMIKIYRDYILEDSGIATHDLADAIIEILRTRFDLDTALEQSLEYEIANFDDNVSFAKSLRDITSDAYISIKQINY